MSKTPIFDQTLANYPGLWIAAPKVFPWPPHQTSCPFDGYNWHVCICPDVLKQLKVYQFARKGEGL